MNYKAILNLTFGIHTCEGDKIMPGHEHSGKAIKLIRGTSFDECLQNVKEFLRESEITLLKEEPQCPVQRSIPPSK
jgi:hypothetical protein